MAEPKAPGLVLVILAAGTLASGVLPQPWVRLATQAAHVLGGGSVG